jgi:hypothetical protein
MTQSLPTLLLAALAAVAAVTAPVPAGAEDSKDATYEPDKGPNPDLTTDVRYRQAMRNADRRLKDSLAQCDRMGAADRAQCVRNANQTHDADIAHANDFLERPPGTQER